MARQNNADYWAQRIKRMEEALQDQSYDYVENLDKQFALAQNEIEQQISMWYQRFAANNEITLADAKKLLNAGELKEFQWTVEDYIKHGQENALTGQWMKELENASARVHISRLDALKLQIQQQAEVLYSNQLDFVDAAARKMYEGSYYHTAFEIQRGLGVGWSMHALNESTIEKVLSRPWTADNQTFRDRCWTNKQSLVSTVNTQLTQMIIRGEAPDRAITAISKQFDVSRQKAGRLVMTESAYFASAAQKDCYAELGVEQYKIVASFDHSTCALCGDMDGKVFKMSEYQEGLTAPPFHPWCRCCTAPYFEDMEGIGERWTRTEDGTAQKVPANMTFEEWKEQYVQPSTALVQRKAKVASTNNRVTDVTEYYFKDAVPGQGTIEYDADYVISKHKDEIATARMLRDTFGGNIRLLTESTKSSVKTADYIWRGKLWELKGTASINGADKSLQRAIKQIQDNPGGVILNWLAEDMDFDVLQKQLMSRFLRSKIKKLDIMLLKSGEVFKILRYKK